MRLLRFLAVKVGDCLLEVGIRLLVFGLKVETNAVRVHHHDWRPKQRHPEELN